MRLTGHERFLVRGDVDDLLYVAGVYADSEHIEHAHLTWHGDSEHVTCHADCERRWNEGRF